jgi:hypothetical protein
MKTHLRPICFGFCLLFNLTITAQPFEKQINNEEDSLNLQAITKKEAGRGYTIFSPTAFTLQKNAWEYQSAWFLVNHVRYGIHKNITVGVSGILPLYLIGFGIGTAKISFPFNDHVQAGFGAFGGIANLYDFDEDNPTFNAHGIGGAYGTLTVSQAQGYFNLHAGFANRNQTKWMGGSFSLHANKSLSILMDGGYAWNKSEDDILMVGIGASILNAKKQSFKLSVNFLTDIEDTSFLPLLSLNFQY